ncbi:unnamed protein product [Owenia fusiformis]|uniref:Uncharacterized protein n=1 Tax=Owenia fusiformis TaxID=6347 RepID=A0A8J1U836_OWEFU|nr:unnamed protein product [Owenia fusiformis]
MWIEKLFTFAIIVANFWVSCGFQDGCKEVQLISYDVTEFDSRGGGATIARTVEPDDKKTYRIKSGSEVRIRCLLDISVDARKNVQNQWRRGYTTVLSDNDFEMKEIPFMETTTMYSLRIDGVSSKLGGVYRFLSWNDYLCNSIVSVYINLEIY